MRRAGWLVVFVALAAASCGGNQGMMNGPSGTERMGSAPNAPGATSLLSVEPAGGSVGVSSGTTITLRFSHAMFSGMESLVDLHRGDVSGPTIPMACAWSGDAMTLTCTPSSPLEPHAVFAIHVGGGMMDADDHPVDLARYGMGMGGQWATPGMMGSHAGLPWNMMGPGWHAANGSYGMVFTFTTA